MPFYFSGSHFQPDWHLFSIEGLWKQNMDQVFAFFILKMNFCHLKLSRLLSTGSKKLGTVKISQRSPEGPSSTASRGVYLLYIYAIPTAPQPVSAVREELIRHLLNEYHQELEEAVFSENLFHSVPIIRKL